MHLQENLTYTYLKILIVDQARNWAPPTVLRQSDTPVFNQLT